MSAHSLPRRKTLGHGHDGRPGCAMASFTVGSILGPRDLSPFGRLASCDLSPSSVYASSHWDKIAPSPPDQNLNELFQDQTTSAPCCAKARTSKASRKALNLAFCTKIGSRWATGVRQVEGASGALTRRR